MIGAEFPSRKSISASPLEGEAIFIGRGAGILCDSEGRVS